MQAAGHLDELDPAQRAAVEHGVADGSPWYAMEIVEGVSLRERLEAVNFVPLIRDMS